LWWIEDGLSAPPSAAPQQLLPAPTGRIERASTLHAVSGTGCCELPGPKLHDSMSNGLDRLQLSLGLVSNQLPLVLHLDAVLPPSPQAEWPVQWQVSVSVRGPASLVHELAPHHLPRSFNPSPALDFPSPLPYFFTFRVPIPTPTKYHQNSKTPPPNKTRSAPLCQPRNNSAIPSPPPTAIDNLDSRFSSLSFRLFDQNTKPRHTPPCSSNRTSPLTRPLRPSRASPCRPTNHNVYVLPFRRPPAAPNACDSICCLAQPPWRP
jgi:hypothetical protein